MKANGGLTIKTLVLRGEQFVDGIYVPKFESEEVPAA